MQGTAPVGEITTTEGVEGAGGESKAELRSCLLVFINAGGGEDNVIDDLKDVDVCQIIISVWRCNIKGQLGNIITI